MYLASSCLTCSGVPLRALKRAPMASRRRGMLSSTVSNPGGAEHVPSPSMIVMAISSPFVSSEACTSLYFFSASCTEPLLAKCFSTYIGPSV